MLTLKQQLSKSQAELKKSQAKVDELTNSHNSPDLPHHKALREELARKSAELREARQQIETLTAKLREFERQPEKQQPQMMPTEEHIMQLVRQQLQQQLAQPTKHLPNTQQELLTPSASVRSSSRKEVLVGETHTKHSKFVPALDLTSVISPTNNNNPKAKAEKAGGNLLQPNTTEDSFTPPEQFN